ALFLPRLSCSEALSASGPANLENLLDVRVD
ncbi:hypothetical protein A2U01_0022079, partial [Trifolium medium]|nr:hypothetical protein [Trifolium medium]